MPESIMLRCTACGTLNRAPSGKAGMRGRCGQCGKDFTVPVAPPVAIDVTDSDFEAEVRSHGGPVLLEFWSPSCGHCVRMMPAVKELARELGGRLKVAMMDVSRNSRIPSLFEVRGTPAFVLMKGGREAARFVGAMPKEELFRRLQPYI